MIVAVKESARALQTNNRFFRQIVNIKEEIKENGRLLWSGLSFGKGEGL